MPNSIGESVTKYTSRLDTIIEQETRTSDLNIDSSLLGEFDGAGTIKIAKIAMSGLGDYSRSNGFPDGDVNLSWSYYKLRFDRGRKFDIDRMDDEERLRLITGNTLAEFERTKVIPEVDAVRFATLCEKAGQKKAAALADDKAVADAVMEAEEAIEDTGADLSQVIFYCTSKVKGALRRQTPHQFGSGENPNTNFDVYDEMRIRVVPGNRFYSAVTTLDGTKSGEEDGGYKKADGATDIDFLLVLPSAAAAIQRHKTLRYFMPEENQEKDAHKWQYRLYHDLLVYENKVNYIFAHTGAAA